MKLLLKSNCSAWLRPGDHDSKHL